MAKRSISDQEIALIKAMLGRKMKNKDIQFFFNRPDRPVNSGRITGVANGSYGDSGKIAAATDAVLDAFIKAAAEPASTVSAPPPSPLDEAVLRGLFGKDAGGVWRFKAGESDEHECKLGFGFKHAGKWVRAIAALANNRGGYVLFGVHDKDTPKAGEPDRSYQVAGMAGEEFQKADPADISAQVKGTLDPTPRVQIVTLDIDGLPIGIIYVEQHRSRPVVATRQVSDQIREGDIFYRYPGQSMRIKYSDLRAILDERDNQAREQILPMVERLLSLGPSRAMVADLDSGALSDGQRKIIIDQDLVDRITFIKEGQFDEREGAPTLRLVGEVVAAGGGAAPQEKGGITQADVIRDFLDQKAVYEPKEYIRAAVEGAQATWLPIHYFANKASMTGKALAQMIKNASASEARKATILKYASGKASAYSKPVGAPLQMMKDIEKGTLPPVTTPNDASKAATAVMGLKAQPAVGLKALLDLLKTCRDAAAEQKSGAALSLVRRAVCRVDELYYRKAPAP